MHKKIASALILTLALATLTAPSASAQIVRVKDIARVQGVTANQLVGYGLVSGLAGTGDSTSVVSTSKAIQNVLQAFGQTVGPQDVRTRNVAAVIVTASLPPFAHSGDNIDVTVSSMGDSTSLQGGTLIMTELKGANNLVYGTAQGPVSIGGFSAGGGTDTVARNHPAAGRVPQGAIIARDMITNLTQDAQGFSYVLTTPDYKTASRLVAVLNQHFGGIARAYDAETVRVNLPPRYVQDPVSFLADAGDLTLNSDQVAKVVLNERTGTVVMGGDVTLGPVAVAHGNLTVTITTANRFVPPGAFSSAPGGLETNTRISAKEGGQKLVYFRGAATLSQVVRSLNTLGVSPRDLIAIVQALRESGSLQADLEMI